MKTPRHPRCERGATIIEFALALLVFLMFLFGILDFSRMLFTWVAANEAARAGARYAAVCDDTAQQAKVLARMQALLPQWGMSYEDGCRGTTAPARHISLSRNAASSFSKPSR